MRGSRASIGGDPDLERVCDLLLGSVATFNSLHDLFPEVHRVRGGHDRSGCLA